MIIDIFNSRFFNAVEMTTAMNVTVPPPLMLGSFGERLFPTMRSRTRMVAVRRHGGLFTLIPTSPIGAPLVELEKTGDQMVPFMLHRLGKGSTVLAEMLNGILSDPEAMQFQTVAEELNTRGEQIKVDLEVTREHMRLGCIFGLVYDADGVTVIDNWFTNWGVTPPTPINFNLDVATTNIRAKCQLLYDAVTYNNEGGWVPGAEVHALCGVNFFSLLTSHPNVEKFWMNWSAAADLRSTSDADTFQFGGITWHKYRGSIDGTTLAIDANTARAFPVGTDAFQRVQGPAEFEPYLNSPGLDFYSINIPDRDRGAWTRVEVYSYPLYICRRPKMLQVAIAL